MIFGVSFGFLEAAVVVYLRRILYPEGFMFPLDQMPPELFYVECVREACTLAMLVCLGMLCARGGTARLSVIMVVFGAWDIFYYFGLTLFLGWPSSLLTWDLLFLIPVPWVAPILAPILISLALLGCGSWFLIQDAKKKIPRVSGGEWAVSIAGGGLVLISLMWHGNKSWGGEVPSDFPWILFGVGEALALATFFRIQRRNRTRKSQS